MHIMSAIQNELVCIVGDFNSIRDNRERTNCVYRRRDMKEFNALIKDANLMDLGLGNDNYTWFSPQGKCSKLDRFLVNGVWLELGSWSVSSLCRISSDHKPIHLKCEKILWGPKPFRGFNWWLQEDSLLKKLDSFWNEKKAINSGMNIQDTLKFVKGIIKPWSHDSKNTLQRRMKCLKEKLDDFDRNNVWGSERDNIKKELMSCFEKHESMLRQKSRYKWLLQGDRNSKFYNQIIQKRKNRNRICKVWWKGENHTSPNAVKNAFFMHFNGIYNQKRRLILSLGNLINLRITKKERIEMEAQISIQEVEYTLHSLGSDRAPGPDGFNILFIKKFWPHIRNKVMECFKAFEDNNVLPKGFNSSFVALIPKVLSPQKVQDYRPISLLNSLAKILTKVLANIMEKLNEKIFDEHQHGFIKGRHAAESILIVHEVEHLLMQQREMGFILKLDFEKAFDTVN